TDLVGAVIANVTARELEAVRAAADAAPGPLSALAAGIGTFAARALGARRLMWALLGEAVDAELEPLRLEFQRALAGELDIRIRAAAVRKLLPEQDLPLSAPAIIGALAQSLLGPLVPAHADPAAARAGAGRADGVTRRIFLNSRQRGRRHVLERQGHLLHAVLDRVIGDVKAEFFAHPQHGHVLGQHLAAHSLQAFRFCIRDHVLHHQPSKAMALQAR